MWGAGEWRTVNEYNFVSQDEKGSGDWLYNNVLDINELYT